MGSSSVSCALTGVTLANQPAVLIPLAPASFSGPLRDAPSTAGGAVVISNEGACAVYGPLALPLFGRVGDYADFEDLEEDENTALLRELLRTDDLEPFTQAVARGGTHPRIDQIAKAHRLNEPHTSYRKSCIWHGGISGCWVERKAWDKFSTAMWNENGSSRYSVFDDGWLDPEVLKGLGFVKGAKNEARAVEVLGDGHHDGKRHHTPWTHPALPRVIVWCDQHMSSQAELDGKKFPIGLKMDEFLKALKKVGMALPKASLDWAKNTCVLRRELTKARSLYRRSVKSDKDHEKFLAENPQCRFSLVEDNTPASVLEAQKQKMHATLREMGILKDQSQGDVPEAPETTVPETRISQVFCDGKYDVAVTGKAGREDAETFEIRPCTNKGHGSVWKHADPIQFTPAVWEALTAQGWKPARRRRFMTGLDGPYLRCFAPEMLRLYRGKLLSDPMLPHVEALLTFISNMGAANRLLGPTAGGWQCGNPATQLRVAQMGVSLVRDIEKRRRSWR